MKRLILAAPLLMLAACGSANDDAGPGGLTPSQEQELNEAASAIDANAAADAQAAPGDANVLDNAVIVDDADTNAQ